MKLHQLLGRHRVNRILWRFVAPTYEIIAVLFAEMNQNSWILLDFHEWPVGGEGGQLLNLLTYMQCM